jgi:hypothetical protein
MRRHHPRHLLAAVAMVGVLLLGHADPAGAAFNPQLASASWNGSCSGDGVYYSPFGWVYMRENGKSGVIQLRAKYRLYRTNVIAGFNYPRREKTYRSARFPNDTVSYGTYVPSSGHQWFGIEATSTYRLNVKMTWDRGWRRDWNYSADVAYCG